VNILKKKFLDISPKEFGSAYAAQSPQKYSNFEILVKIEGKACVPLRSQAAQ
jgi:hypothetical protein